MAKRVSLILIFTVIAGVLFNGAILKAEVKNEDNPLKGNWDFKLRKLWEVDRAGDTIMAQIADIQIDDDGRIYILESKQDKFFVFDQNGKFLYSFGNRGEGPGEYKLAFSFFLKGQYVIVPDQDRAHYFNKDGKYVKSYNYGTVVYPRAHLDEFRFLIVRDSSDEKIKLDKLEILDINSMKYTPLADISAEKSMTASTGKMSLKFKDASTTPMVIIAEHNNEIYFGKNDRYFIKKVDTNGKELLSFSISGREQKKIPEKLKRERFENTRLNNQQMPKELIDQMVKNMPDYCTYYNRIEIDKRGLVYIYLIDFINKTVQEMDIFSPEGKYLFHADIQLPQGLKRVTPLSIKENSLIVFAEDEDGEQKLVKFQIDTPTNYLYGS
ncbi:MAG TPA: 6-bladed beta-propeller [Candidatus Kapabacteria bacterium]|nr:6-bladed beta-propeller [Candidatus Kapabacteria bacterium]